LAGDECSHYGQTFYQAGFAKKQSEGCNRITDCCGLVAFVLVCLFVYLFVSFVSFVSFVTLLHGTVLRQKHVSIVMLVIEKWLNSKI
jgi:hypothetical protein